MEEESGSSQGPVACGSWIRRPEKVNLAVLARSRKQRGDSSSSSPSVLQIFSFDPKTASLSSSPLTTYVLEEVDGDPVSITVHPSGDEIVCSTTKGGCKLFELVIHDSQTRLLAKELPPLQGVGPLKCIAFSVDGSRFATGGEDGRLRILEWPSLRIILDEPKAHKSVRDMDFSINEEEVPPSIEKSKQGNKNNGAMKNKSILSKRPRGRPRKKPIEDNEAIATQSKRLIGRPRKNPIENSLDNLDCNDQYVQGLVVQLSENSSEAKAVDGVPRDAQEHFVQEESGKKQKHYKRAASVCDPKPESHL